jgi:hypothetical protein
MFMEMLYSFGPPQLGCEESFVHPTPGARVVAGQPCRDQVQYTAVYCSKGTV